MLNQYFEIPINEPWLRKMPAIEPVILHLHRFAIVSRRTIYMIRDPRDIVVSHYHKILSDSSSESRAVAARYCDFPLSHQNLRINLSGYIRFLFDSEQMASISIDRHIRKARSLGLYTARYEDLLERGEDTFTGIVEYLSEEPVDLARLRATVEATTFEKHTGRKAGDEDVTAAVGRKGIAGDWKNCFTPEAANTFLDLAGDLLIECGYELDASWVDRTIDPGED
jgi:hypothetical protein